MQWELRGDRPIYQQLVEKLTEQIVSGQHAARACGNGARGPDVHQPHERTLCNGGQRNDW